MTNPDKDKNKLPVVKYCLAVGVIVSSFALANISDDNMTKVDKALDILSKLWVVVEITE